MNKKEHLKAHKRIGLWLKDHRLKAGMTQDQVGDMIEGEQLLHFHRRPECAGNGDHGGHL